ncbi:K(+)-transporting ATPase subunit F [Brachybacterium timonense]
MIQDIVGALLGFAIVAYLLFALTRPEKF